MDQDGNNLQLKSVQRIASYNTFSQVLFWAQGYVSKIEGDSEAWLEECPEWVIDQADNNRLPIN